MSLQVWLPLNGNINNQGVLDVSTSGAPASWSNGKIGKCATFTGNIANRITTPDMQALRHTNNFSYCVWLNQNYSSSASQAHQFAFTYGRADAGSYGYGIAIISTTTIRCWFGTRATEISCPANEWHHIAVTVSGTTIKYYVDGILSKTANTATLPTYLDSECKGLGLGCFHYSGDIYPYYGSMNDFRIYDHCLSAREVKEISKGLFLHYKLGGVDGYFGGKNLAIGTLTAEINSHWKTNGWTPSFTTYSKEERIYKLVATNGWVVARYILDSSYAKKNITLSFKAKKVSKETTATEDSRIFYSNATGTNPYLTDHFDIANKADTWFDLSITVKLNDDHQIGIGVRCSPENKILKTTWLIKDIKIEESDKPTAWTPAPEDNPALYDTTLYDTSGYLGTATPSGTIGYSSDSPRYDGSYVFSDTSHFKLTQPLVSPSQFTCSFWVKPTSLGSYAIVTSNYNNPSSGFWIAVNCEGSGLWFYNGSYARSNKGLLTLNTWYHACLVFKDGVFTWYQNGEAAGTTDLSSRSKTLDIANTISIGNSFTGTQWNTNFNGNISDFRMYSTALSAADVKELYNTPITLTNTGTLMTQGEFKEV